MSDDIPTVCFIDDLCRVLGISRTTVKRLRRHRAFPIEEMPSLDKRPRWSGARVREFIAERKVSRRIRRIA